MSRRGCEGRGKSGHLHRRVSLKLIRPPETCIDGRVLVRPVARGSHGADSLPVPVPCVGVPPATWAPMGCRSCSVQPPPGRPNRSSSSRCSIPGPLEVTGPQHLLCRSCRSPSRSLNHCDLLGEACPRGRGMVTWSRHKRDPTRRRRGEPPPLADTSHPPASPEPPLHALPSTPPLRVPLPQGGAPKGLHLQRPASKGPATNTAEAAEAQAAL